MSYIQRFKRSWRRFIVDCIIQAHIDALEKNDQLSVRRYKER